MEIAARRGFGPLSPLAQQAWHGDSMPCVSCGQLVRRDATRCDACGEDLSAAMIARMRAFAGPWYVHEHVRPFPGVTCERLARQVRRGVLTKTTIVRGPTTDHQWRYAAETPGLSKLVGVCWNCQAGVAVDGMRCAACGVELGALTDLPVGGAASQLAPAPHAAQVPQASAAARYHVSPELRALSDAVKSHRAGPIRPPEAPQVGALRASWIAAVIMLLVLILMFVMVQLRSSANPAVPPASTALQSES